MRKKLSQSYADKLSNAFKIVDSREKAAEVLKVIKDAAMGEIKSSASATTKDSVEQAFSGLKDMVQSNN